MTFGQSIKTCFSKYATFSGCASRSEFWWFWLFNALLSWTVIVPIIAFIPSLAVLVRRLNDTGRSAMSLLWILLPGIGGLIILFFCMGDSKGEK